MDSTKSGSTASSNGSAPAVGSAIKGAGETATDAVRRARGPMLAAGAAAAGLAGGLAVGSRRGGKRALFDRRPRLLGVPVGPKSGAARTIELLMESAKHLDSASRQVSGATDDVRELNDQLDRMNRRSPLEVVLDGLTHRRGAHKRET
jgi:hypothetical protein